MAALAGQVALVTGASAPGGIGRACALRLAQDGAAVVVTDIGGTAEFQGTRIDRMDLLAGLAAQIEKNGGRAMAMALDVTQAGQIRAGLTRVQDVFGRLDILVNNAGSLAGSADFLDTTPDQWTASFQVNLLGPMMLTQAVLPLMQAQGAGAIVNIGSTGSLGAEPGFGAYTAMKHGLIGLTKTIAAEFGVDGIRCNAVCPGYVNTDMHMAANTRLAEEAGVALQTIKARRYSGVALRRAGDPAEVADAVAYLAGPQSRYVTGVALPVSGGTPPGI